MNYQPTSDATDPVTEPAPTQAGEGETMFALLEAAGVVQARLDAALAEVGLSMAKYRALEQLARCNEPLTLSELASRRQCVRSNVTQLVDRLEADGLVRRVDDLADRRAIRAVLTPLGVERHAAGREAIRRQQAELAARVAPADRALFHRVLAALG
jgi:DNA-binding MarR family transcriptional regulator